MVVAANMALESCLCSADTVARQNALLAALGLPIEYHGSVQAQALLSTMQLDKKVVGKRVQWIMPLHIGEVMITPMPDELVMRALATFFVET
jgi:3-dehydroquinate synthetase